MQTIDKLMIYSFNKATTLKTKTLGNEPMVITENLCKVQILIKRFEHC